MQLKPAFYFFLSAQLDYINFGAKHELSDHKARLTSASVCSCAQADLFLSSLAADVLHKLIQL